MPDETYTNPVIPGMTCPPSNRNRNREMSSDPDYRQNLMVSSVVHAPPFHQVLWKQV